MEVVAGGRAVEGGSGVREVLNLGSAPSPSPGAVQRGV